MSDYADFSQSLTRGSTHRFRFTVINQDTGLAVDITNWTQFWVYGKKNLYDTDAQAIFAFTLGSGIVVINAPTGLCEVDMAPVNTTSLDFSRFVLYAEIRGKDPSGNVWSLARGTVTVIADVVQATS